LVIRAGSKVRTFTNQEEFKKKAQNLVKKATLAENFRLIDLFDRMALYQDSNIRQKAPNSPEIASRNLSLRVLFGPIEELPISAQALAGPSRQAREKFWVKIQDFFGTVRFVDGPLSTKTKKLSFQPHSDSGISENLTKFLRDSSLTIRCLLLGRWEVRLIDSLKSGSSNHFFRREDVHLAQLYGRTLEHIYIPDKKKRRVEELKKVGINPTNLLSTFVQFLVPGLEHFSPSYVGWSGFREEHQTQIPVLPILQRVAKDIKNFSSPKNILTSVSNSL
jgi:hypothetical protein